MLVFGFRPSMIACVLSSCSSMEYHNRAFKYFCIAFIFLLNYSSSRVSTASVHPLVAETMAVHSGSTAISDFRMINRKRLKQCPGSSPYLQINVQPNSGLADEEFLNVTVGGVTSPSDQHWVAMISPTDSDVESCPLSKVLYMETGDFSSVPLLCHYPVKAQYMKNDPDYLPCKKQECKNDGNGQCQVKTCSGSLSFHVINIRTDVEFVLFSGGFGFPCVLARSKPISFANPNKPLYGHISSTDSTGTSMRLTWVSGDKQPQQVQYRNGKAATSEVTTFSRDDMCTSVVPSPAKDYGWHDPGYIHSAVMTGLDPSSNYSYRYGSDSVGWSEQVQFRTPPAAGSDELKFIAFGDMGKAPHDPSVEHFIQPGSLSVIKAIGDEVDSGNINSIFHIGDISYATGFLVEWDFFLHLISPVASRVSYMTAIGNHERDYINSNSVYVGTDSGGECGVPYETYFQMPTVGADKPWYSIEQASVHFTVMSTEHDWSENSEQYEWLGKDMAAVNRTNTPWLVFMGGVPKSVDQDFVKAVEPLLLKNKVDLVLVGHVHNYERTCSVYQNECKQFPKVENGVDIYDCRNYSAPVHAVIGMAGFALDNFTDNMVIWSIRRISEFGYLRGHATREELQLEFVNAATREIQDSVRLFR